MLSKINQTQKANHCTIPVTGGTRISKFRDRKSKRVTRVGWGEELLMCGHRADVGDEEEALGKESGDGYTIL